MGDLVNENTPKIRVEEFELDSQYCVQLQSSIQRYVIAL